MLSDAARAFHRRYRSEFRRYQSAAAFAEGLVRDALRDGGFNVHQISARAKSPDALLRKLRQKQYDDPAVELTDQVAVRVITYYMDEVDPVITRLRSSFTVDEIRSVDKRSELNVREFGYRSVHLIVQARLQGLEGPAAEPLRDIWFEIQVRSLLEHAWAEIEHEVVYKSGVDFPEQVLREFAAVAAQLEALDRRFLELREGENRLTDDYRGEYARATNLEEALDAARLRALVEDVRPSGASFRQLAERGASLPPHAEACCVEALRSAGIATGQALTEALESPEVKGRIESYASLQGITPDEVSHFAVCVLAAATGDPEQFIQDYEDLLRDSALEQSIRPEESNDDDDA